MNGTVYLIPTFLHEQGMHALPAYTLEAVQQCSVFFVENERSARRYLKKLWPQMVIDNYQWHTIHKAEEQVKAAFKAALQTGAHVGIISEAGCPGIADPGQLLVAEAQQLGAVVKPLTGPNSILLALMASGMNGQHFHFWGYLPIDNHERRKKLKELESESQQRQCTQIFIETPFRNNQLINEIMNTCRPTTRLCIAADITAPGEYIHTKTIADWKKQLPDMHKRLCIFLLIAE